MLLDKTRQTIERLLKMEKARNNVNEAQDLAELRKELGERVVRIDELSRRANVLRAEKIPLAPIAETVATKQSVSEVAARFSEVASAATLKKGKRWSTLIGKLDVLNATVRTRQLEDWKTFHSNGLFAGAPPDQVRARLAMTPGNTKALTQYTALFGRFSAHRASVPENRESVALVRECSDALARIKFDENVPIEVAKFFEATGSSAGADLELLTESVVTWLRVNGLLQTYVVRARIF